MPSSEVVPRSRDHAVARPVGWTPRHAIAPFTDEVLQLHPAVRVMDFHYPLPSGGRSSLWALALNPNTYGVWATTAVGFTSCWPTVPWELDQHPHTLEPRLNTNSGHIHYSTCLHMDGQDEAAPNPVRLQAYSLQAGRSARDTSCAHARPGVITSRGDGMPLSHRACL